MVKSLGSHEKATACPIQINSAYAIQKMPNATALAFGRISADSPPRHQRADVIHAVKADGVPHGSFDSKINSKQMSHLLKPTQEVKNMWPCIFRSNIRFN